MKLPGAPDEARPHPVGRGGSGFDAEEPEPRHRLGLPLQRERPSLVDGHGASDEGVGGGAHQDLARSCRGLEPGRDVHRIAHHQRPAALPPDHDLTGVHPDPRLERHTPGGLELGVQLDQGVAHLRGRAHGTERVVLVELGHPEDRHHGVADVFLDGTAVAFEHRSHALEEGGHHAAHRLRVEALAQRRRADDVAEDDRKGLAGLAGRGREGLRQRLGARHAEPSAGRVHLTTDCAGRHRPRV